MPRQFQRAQYSSPRARHLLPREISLTELPRFVLLPSPPGRVRLPWKNLGHRFLRRRLDEMLEAGVRFVGLEQARAVLHGLGTSQPQSEAILVACCSESEFQDEVLGILRERQLPSLLFVDTADSYLSADWNELAALAADDVSIGLRGTAAIEDGQRSIEANYSLLLRQRREMERRLGRPCAIYAHRASRPNSALLDLLRRSGFELGCARGAPLNSDEALSQRLLRLDSHEALSLVNESGAQQALRSSEQSQGY